MAHDATRRPSARDWLGRRRSAFWGWWLPYLLLAVPGILGREILGETLYGLCLSVALAWIGLACLANGVRCGRVHCLLQGPPFLILGLVAGARTAGLIEVSWTLIWLAAIAVAILAWVPEFLGKRYFGSPSH